MFIIITAQTYQFSTPTPGEVSHNYNTKHMMEKCNTTLHHLLKLIIC